MPNFIAMQIAKNILYNYQGIYSVGAIYDYFV